jgi:hypothetical protein
VKGTAANALVRDFGEEALDEVEPRSARRGEVQVISRVSLQPFADGFVRVGPLIVENDVDVQFLWDGAVDPAQEAEKLLMAVARPAGSVAQSRPLVT